MNDEDYAAVIEYLTGRLREVGLNELADEDRYFELDADTGSVRLPAPNKILVEMLDAFQRHLSICDRATYKAAMTKISNVLKTGIVEEVLVVPIEGGSADRRPVNLGNAPDLSEAREMVRSLSGQLIEAYRPGGSSL